MGKRKRMSSTSSDDMPLLRVQPQATIIHRSADNHSLITMGKRKRVSSSSSDDMPLLRLKGADLTAALYMYSQENCQLCEKIFHNRYDYLVHYASHITIPLMRNSIPHCPPCKKHFTTEENLQLHNDKHHKTVPDILASIIHNKPVVKCDSSVNELIRINNEQRLNDIINKEVVVRCNDDLAELLKASNSNDLKYQDDEEPMECDSTVNEPEVDGKVESDTTSTVEEDVIYEIEDSDDEEAVASNAVTSNIKSRLVFEEDDDIEDDIIQIPQNGMYEAVNSFNGVHDLTEESDSNRINENEEANKGHIILGIKVVYTPAVHYEELTVPGRHECLRCSKTFGNRLELIQHEKSHLKFRLRQPILCTYCDRYIAGNHYTLRTHLSKKHNGAKQKTRSEKCKRCGLKYYSIRKHKMNYHRIYVCPLCEHRFEDQSKRDAHVSICKGLDDDTRHMLEYKTEHVKVIKICELCALFCKNNQARYVHLGEFSKEGERVTCERCEKQFFEVKLVKKITKVKEQWHEKKKPTVTNASRLKNIQKRLKMLSKLNKF